MKKILITIAILGLSSALASAQDTGAASTSANTNSWTGLLIAAGCSSGMPTGTKGTTDAAMPLPRATPTPAREQNTTYEDRAMRADRNSTGSSTGSSERMARRTDRGASVDQATPALTDPVTTPPVDDKGTRGSATKNTPSTGVKDQSNSADRSKSAMEQDHVNGGIDSGSTAAMDRSCYIGQSTTAFALKLKDGRIVNFDAAGNEKIAQQLRSGDRLQDKVKIFRATVKGSMQGDTITVDSIQM